jgi:hypothetical protein
VPSVTKRKALAFECLNDLDYSRVGWVDKSFTHGALGFETLEGTPRYVCERWRIKANGLPMRDLCKGVSQSPLFAIVAEGVPLAGNPARAAKPVCQKAVRPSAAMRAIVNAGDHASFRNGRTQALWM